MTGFLGGSPAESAPPRLSVSDVRVSYRGVPAVDGVTLALSPGITALVGPNGAGKSTLMRVLTGAQRAGAGQVRFNEGPVRGRAAAHFRRRLGYLPQNPSWHRWMSAVDTVASFAWMHGVPRRRIRHASLAALDLVGLAARGNSKAGALSGGQFQRLMLATRLVHEPDVLVLDEPTVGLDPEQRLHIREIIANHCCDRIVLISTHMLDDVATTADRIVVMESAKVLFDGAPDGLVREHGRTAHDRATPLEGAYLSLLRTRAPDAD